ncbi:MAG TPA: hemerythrin domain-containing protein [Bacteroidia bacterium]|nr:hemerythrin domain-containing protein [Bacteroidia bacterium]
MPLKRHQALINLSRDHYSGLLLASVLKKDTPDFKNMPVDPSDKAEHVKAKYESELKAHFETEEKVLFPYIKGRSEEINKIIHELIAEHRIIEQGINSLSESSDLVTSLDNVGKLLESHIRKEERQLFESIQELLTEKELIDLEKKLVSG